MSSDAFQAALSRYTAAYNAYQEALQRVARKLANGLIPSAEEVNSEAAATEQLAAARRELLDQINRLIPPRG